MYSIDVVHQVDPEIADAIQAEMNRQETRIELIASENFASIPVMSAMGTPLTNKYAEGYPGHRYYGGCEFVDVIELNRFSAAPTPTYSPTAVPRPTRLWNWPCASRAIPFWG